MVKAKKCEGIFAGIFLDASSSGEVDIGLTSSLISPWQSVSQPSCVSFIYHKTTVGAAVLQVSVFVLSHD